MIVISLKPKGNPLNLTAIIICTLRRGKLWHCKKSFFSKQKQSVLLGGEILL